MRIVLVAAYLLVLPRNSSGQTHPAFEAASIRPAAPQAQGSSMRGGPGSSDPGRIAYSNVQLVAILMAAYDVRSIQIHGPAWINTQRYDLAATLAAGSTAAQLQEMLRDLLAQRFRLVAHEVTRSIDGYELSITKNGPKLRPPHEAGFEESLPPSFRALSPGAQNLLLMSGSLTTRTRDYLARRGGTMAQLAERIPLDGPVVDRTGLTGEYDYYVEFAPPSLDLAAADDPAPSIFTAFPEQLGLRLDQKKIALRVVVIDHAERFPEGN